LNLTKDFLRNQGQDPTSLKESIKQNKTHKIWMGKKGNKEKKKKKYLTLF
jgi:hypothetical protein